jgi:hypothetical protein
MDGNAANLEESEEIPPEATYSAFQNELMTRAEDSGRDFYMLVVQDFLETVELSQEQLDCLTKTKSIDELLRAVEDIQKARSGEKKGRITRFLHRLSRGILSQLDRLSPAIDTLVSAHPEISALVWGSIKLVLIVVTCPEE